MLDFRKPSDAAFTATLNSGEHLIRRRTQPEVWCTSTWQLNRTLSWAGVGIVNARKEGWYLVIIFSLMALLVFTAKMLQSVYQIGKRTFFFPLLRYCACRLPDCWSIKIIVMEIDLIDNVPCSHCEQLVPCEYNPETSSKNFPPQTFNPSSSFCPSLQKMGKATARKDKGGNPVLSRTNKTGRGVKFGLGSRSKEDVGEHR